MSNTDKDEPFWVRLKDNLIEHDHRDGRCVVSDDRRGRWGSARHRWASCKKKVTVEWTCTKQEPHRGRGGHYWRRGWDQQTCWIRVRVCTCPIPGEWKNEEHGCGGHWRWIGCIGHTRTEYDPDIPCVCDDWEQATCFPAWPDHWNPYIYGGIPSDFVSEYYHKPERRRERDSLHDARRRYNAGDDLDDFDFHNRQARNSARWLYW